MKSFSLFGLQTIPEVRLGDNLASLIIASCNKEDVNLVPGDIVVITSKIVSKSEGNIVELKNVKHSKRSKAIAKLTGKDPAIIEIIINQSRKIVAAIPLQKIAKHYPNIFENLAQDEEGIQRVLKTEPTMLIAAVKQGGLASEAGLDHSNNPFGSVSLLPTDPDESASKIRKELMKYVGGDVAVVITDTEVAFTHIYGSTEVAVGFAGIRPVSRCFGAKDRFGREKFGGADVIVDELASAAALLMGQTSEGVPVVIIRGLEYSKEEIKMQQNIDAIFKAAAWTVLATLKLKLAGLLEPFM